MKDTSRPHPAPSSRSAPYTTRRASGPVSPTRGTRRALDASQCQTISSRAPDKAQNLRRYETHSRSIYSPDNEHRSHSESARHDARRHTTTDGSVHEQLSHARTISIHADVPGPPLRLPLTSAPSTASASAGQRKAESPPPGSVTAFLRSIELPDKPSNASPLQASLPLIPPSLRLPSLSTDCTNKIACNGNDYQVSLVYKGYPFTYDLSALPDDPKGTIALLTITKSDPGPYLLVGAHYRRTGRPRAACAVIRSLLESLDSVPHVEEGKGDAAPTTTSDTPTPTLPTPATPCPKPIDRTIPVFKSAAMRPAMLLLAACELDISREHPDDPESEEHALTAQQLFRSVYGTANDVLVPALVRPSLKNSLGLEFSSNENCTSISSTEEASLARIKELEKELSAAHSAQKTLQGKLSVSNDRLASTEDKVRTLESCSREMRVQLDASQNENWELRQRLAESEQRARELVRCSPTAESRVWGRLKDLFENLGGVRGE